MWIWRATASPASWTTSPPARAARRAGGARGRRSRLAERAVQALQDRGPALDGLRLPLGQDVGVGQRHLAAAGRLGEVDRDAGDGLIVLRHGEGEDQPPGPVDHLVMALVQHVAVLRA